MTGISGIPILSEITAFLTDDTNSLPYAIVLYGCDTRAVTEQMETSIESLEWKILSNISGPTKDQNGWRIRNNGTFHAACGKRNIVTTIEV